MKEVGRGYSALVKDVDVTTRNAIAHGSVYIRLAESAVAFVDTRAEKITLLNFKELLRRCRLISALVIALFFIGIYFFYARWKRNWEWYKSVRSKSQRLLHCNLVEIL